MFDVFQKNNEEKTQLAAEKREREFVKDQEVFQAGAQDDTQFERVMTEKSDLIRWQQEFDEELEKTKNSLRGLAWNGKEWSRVKKPMCNETFINFFETVCSPFMNKSWINSNLDERRILDRLEKVCNTLTDFMSDNYDSLDIKFVDNDAVAEMTKSFIIGAAYRAINGWTKKTDSTLMKRIEAFNEQTGGQQPKKGSLGWFNA
jgi:hypothetical protein